MFCNEPIRKVYIGQPEYNWNDSGNAFLDCFHDIAYHCTDGYRLLLETENYAVSLSSKGVIKEPKENSHEEPGEWLQDGIEIVPGDEDVPWVNFEHTLFIDERIVSVTNENGIFYVQFDDFTLKLIPYENGDDITSLHNEDHFSYNYILGCDRHLKKKCPHCGGDGEILLDEFNRCYYRLEQW